MADRDFAQLQATARPPEPGMSGPRMGFLVLGIVAVVIVGFIGGYQLGSRQGREKAESAAKAHLVAQIREQKQELAVLRKQHAEDRAKAKAAVRVLPNSDTGDLTFYTDLPKQPVKPEPLSQPVAKPAMSPQAAAKVAAEKAATAKAKAASDASGDTSPAPASPSQQSVVHQVIQHALKGDASASGEGYYVQVASFRDTQKAAKVQAKLSAIGLHARLKRAEVPGRGTWYRLQVGPYGNAHDAGAVRLDIEQKANLKGIIVHEGG